MTKEDKKQDKEMKKKKIQKPGQAMGEKKIEELETKVQTLELQGRGYLEKMMRLGADFENFRKNQSKERKLAEISSKKSILKSLLPFIDSVYTAAETSKDVKPLADQLTQILANLGFKDIAPTRGDDFDPEIHEALMAEESDELEDGKILKIFQKGFLIEDEVDGKKMKSVIRSVRVSVAKSPK